jgi:hypothetical protein
MIVEWWRRRRAMKARIDNDAIQLIAEFGEAAYSEARERALTARRRGDDSTQWGAVRAEMARRTDRKTADTGTRFLSR